MNLNIIIPPLLPPLSLLFVSRSLWVSVDLRSVSLSLWVSVDMHIFGRVSSLSTQGLQIELRSSGFCDQCF